MSEIQSTMNEKYVRYSNDTKERSGDNYLGFLSVMNKGANTIIEGLLSSTNRRVSLFKTNANTLVQEQRLFDYWLSFIPEYARQHYNCNACKHFIDTYGNMAVVDENGYMKPVYWNAVDQFPEEIPELFRIACAQAYKIVSKASIIQPFSIGDSIIGIVSNNQGYESGNYIAWNHMSIKLTNKSFDGVYINKYHQENYVAAKKESYKMIKGALNAFDESIYKKTSQLIKAGVLYRFERVLPMANFIDNAILKMIEEKNDKKRENMIWYYVTRYASSITHIRSSMIGTILEDIRDGYDGDEIIERFNKKMDPINYQRPKVAPSKGNVEEAEKIVAEYGLEDSLKRRYATIEELDLIWKEPKQKESEEVKEHTGIFSNVITKEKQEEEKEEILITLPSDTMTWNKFESKVLPNITKLEIQLRSNQYYGINTYVTEEVPGSKPILFYDKENDRNPVSNYVYKGGSLVRDFIDMNLNKIQTIRYGKNPFEVIGIAREPIAFNNHMHDASDSFVTLIVKGFKDKNSKPGSEHSPGLALFPELLIPELRPVRSTIESFSNSGKISGYENASASGIMIMKHKPGAESTAELTIYTENGKQTIFINGYE